MKKKLLKIACAGLAGIILFNSIQYLVEKETLKAEAMDDTLPGVELIRANNLASGDAYKILEIAPEVRAAEVGFYVDGQEPFEMLSNGDGTWTSWKDKLASYDTAEDRAAFMASLYAEYQTYAAAYGDLLSAEDAPFTWEMAEDGVPYKEYTSAVGSTMDDVNTITTSSAGKRGYFTRTNGGSWNVVFRRVSNATDLDVEEVLNGVGRVYYSAASTGALKFSDIFLMANQGSEVPIYKLETSGYFTFVGYADDIWASLVEAGTVDPDDYVYVEESNTVSGNAVAISNNDDIVTGYHTVDFTRITNNANNQVAAGTEIYVINADMSFTTENGLYDLVETAVGMAAGDEVYTVSDVVYFRGGISNADFFRKNVFGIEEADTFAYTNFKIQVTTVTPSGLNDITSFGSEEAGTDYDMVYIGNAAFKDALAGVDYQGYGNISDMNYKAMSGLFAYIVDNEIPCIVDAHSAYTFVADSENPSITLNNIQSTSGNSYFHSLVGLLMSPVTNKALLLSQLTEGNYYCNTFVNNYASGLAETLEGSNRSYWDLHYVTGNVYVYYDGNTEHYIDYINSNLAPYWDLDDESATVDAGFQEVADEIISENLYREADASAKELQWDVSEATTIAYIIHYHNRRTDATDMTLNVLEIQPAYIEEAYNGTRNGTKEAPGTLTKKMISNWSGVSEANITIHTMQMSEFVGKLDDLNATYDMIYIGGRTSGFNVDRWGNTVYNDESMNGLVYSHVGDVYVIPSRMNQDGKRGYRFIGLMANERKNNGTVNTDLDVTYRFSGNDLTTDKYNALMEYYWSGYPIVIGEDLLDTSGNISTYKVDNSSYLYEFLNTVKGKSKWVFTEDELGTSGTSLFRFYITRSKLTLLDSKGNAVDENGMLYDSSGRVVSSILQTEEYYSVNNTVSQIQPDSYGNHYLTFKFQIKNSSGASYVSDYKVQLYIDSNADGKYSLTSEELLPLTVDKATVTTLKANTVYTVTKQLPSSFQGCISWKLVISQVDNSYVRTSIKGYTRLVTGGDVPVIKILQLIPSDDKSKSLNLEREIGYWDGRQYVRTSNNNETTHDSSMHYWRNATAMAGEYILEIDSVYQTEFNRNPSIVNDPDENYNMLIFGFADGSASLTSAAVDEVQKFINTGKSVLFSHDMAQYYFNPAYATNSNNSAYYVTRKLRAAIGMDPYGVSRNNYDSVLTSGYGMDLVNYSIADYNLAAPAKNTTTGLYSYNTYDLAYTPRASRQSTVGQVHGLNNWFLMLLRYADTYGFRRYLTNKDYFTSWNLSVDDNNNWGYYDGTPGSTGSSISTYYVQQENDGQITNYPFKITGDSEGLVNVGLTHQQWMNLDMYSDRDGDGQTDMVVWYTLSQKAGTYSGAGSASLMLNKGDVTNNYYIYNFGNVTYTGMGHNATYSSDCTTDMEAKLFLNTMVASYNTGVRVPEVVTTDNGLSTNMFYGYYDASSQTSLDDTVRVGFHFNDLNMATSKNMQVQFVKVVDGVESDLTAELVSGGADGKGYVKTADGTPVTSSNLITETGVSGSILSGLNVTKDYYIDIPISYLTTAGIEDYSSQFKIKVRSVITKNTSGSSITSTTEWGYATINYVSISLFELD